MSMRMAVGAALLTAGVGGFVFAQETQRLPGFGSGILKVEGTVDVGNTPLVLAHQSGEWKMVVANQPDVRVVNVAAVSIAPPDFVRKGGRYEVTWATGDRQLIQVVQMAPGGWVRVEAGPRLRWLNLSSARAVDEVS
jgi:hypothetical protein